jgi:hypothetical protein
MDYWLIFQSLVQIIITWGGTMMDSAGAKVNFASNQQDSLVRQIRLGVYLSCDRSILRVSVDQRDFIILEKLRKKSCIKSYR